MRASDKFNPLETGVTSEFHMGGSDTFVRLANNW